jgi:hypothetical protein
MVKEEEKHGSQFISNKDEMVSHIYFSLPFSVDKL